MYKSCVCVSATSASSRTALTRCPADPICKWRLPARASRPTDGDAHWYGQDAQKAERRNKALAILTARLFDNGSTQDAEKSHKGCTS
eukprot:152899-Pyramimonas_sp.AAC.1